MTALEMAALRAAAELPRTDGARGDAGFGDLAADCAARLRARLARPQRASGDWSIELPAGGCTCDLCGTLRAFLEDPNRRTFEWPLAKQRRQHVHSRIDAAELPVTHVDQAAGPPLHARPDARPTRCSPASRRRGPGMKRIWSGSRQNGISALDRCNSEGPGGTHRSPWLPQKMSPPR